MYSWNAVGLSVCFFVFYLALSVVFILSLLFCVSSLVTIKVVSIFRIGYQLDEH